jgi:hypothetical protein
MALHSRTHPEPVDGCYGCKVIGVGVQALQIRHGADPTRRVPVVREVGPTRGTVGGYHTEHWDGRRDATVQPAAIALKAKVTEIG